MCSSLLRLLQWRNLVRQKIVKYFVFIILLIARKNEVQNYDNNPNHERQLPREHDSESADCSDTESEKKPTEKPNQTRGNQKRNCEIHKHRQNKHFFIFPFRFCKCFPSLDVCIITHCTKMSTLCSILPRLLRPKGKLLPFHQKKGKGIYNENFQGMV